MRNRLGIMVAIAILLRSAWDCTPRVTVNWNLWSRLRHAGRPAPDTTWDRYYAELKPYLPPKTSVGLAQRAPAGTPQHEREYYFLQYSLSPRLIVPPGSTEFVVVSPPSAASSLLDSAAYAIVKAYADDFALYRRTRE
jgi:hypothetical protein